MWSNGLKYPITTLKNGVVGRTMGFHGRGFDSYIHHNKLFQIFLMSNSKNTLPGIPRKSNRLDIDRSARIFG